MNGVVQKFNSIENNAEKVDVTCVEVLLHGVLLLMPPVADYELASVFFQKLYCSSKRLEAAVWDAYRFAILFPEGSTEFVGILEENKNSAIAAHMLSLVAAASGNYERALSENRRSRSIRLTPFNIVEGLRSDIDLLDGERIRMWQVMCDLVVKKSSEADAEASTPEGMLQHRWDGHISGTRLTSVVWSSFEGQFGLGRAR